MLQVHLCTPILDLQPNNQPFGEHFYCVKKTLRVLYFIWFFLQTDEAGNTVLILLIES